MDLTGIHHLTAVSADIRDNYRFYTQALGMRLVKRSVNQDDVSAYHLFYADAVGSPGTDLTFFDWNMWREQRGANSITRTCLRVSGGAALQWWEQRFRELGVTIGSGGMAERDGRLTLDFEDPEGQRLALIDDGGQGGAGKRWDASPIPPEFQIRGLGPIQMSVPDLSPTDRILVQVMKLRAEREYTHTEVLPQATNSKEDNTAHRVVVYAMGAGGPHAELHVAVQPDLPTARLGAGGVHHVAFRTPNEEQYHAWTARLDSMGVRNSGEIDRYYFRSLYFREPNGILFEIATDGPGFAVDEDARTLGESVVLPPFLEPRRQEILAGLKPID